jgi:hypothetical protein
MLQEVSEPNRLLHQTSYQVRTSRVPSSETVHGGGLSQRQGLACGVCHRVPIAVVEPTVVRDESARASVHSPQRTRTTWDRLASAHAAACLTPSDLLDSCSLTTGLAGPVYL